MTATRTPSQRGAYSARKGKTAERDLAKYLRESGWPQASRAVVTGSSVTDGAGVVHERPDPGDVAGLPGVIVSCKDVAAEAIGPWLSELDAMATLAGEPAALRVLVVKRPRNPVARWWAWLRAEQYAGLVGGATSSTRPVRMELADLVFELHRAGYATAEVSA